MDKIRLQKFISECGIMSRRAAEVEISAGRITVNGIKATLGDKVDPENDTVEFDGHPVIDKKCGSDEVSRNTYIILNKPVGYVTTMKDEQGRKTIRDLIKDVPVRVYPVGRLDMFSDGLLLCTDDGELTNRITHPSHAVAKQYLATITERLDDDALKNLAQPFVLDGYMLRDFGVEFVENVKADRTKSTIVRFTLYEGRNREIRKICAHHGYKLARLTRISIGKLNLEGLLPGKWRYLTNGEIEYLKSI